MTTLDPYRGAGKVALLILISAILTQVSNNGFPAVIIYIIL